MGALGEGIKEGQKAGKKHGQRAGAKSDENGNKYKESLKAAGKGAASAAPEGAARGAVKGGVSGVKSGIKTGSEIGGAIPYVGVVTGPLGGVVGGIVGGIGGTTIGAGAGALSASVEGAKEGAVESERKRKSARNFFSDIWEDAKKIIKGDVKSIFRLKIKSLTLGLAIVTLVFLALIAQGVSENTSSVAAATVSSTFENKQTSSANLFNTTGSLILATEDELEYINTEFMSELENSNEGYYDALSVKYSGNSGSTVANRVQHITTNFESGEKAELDKVANNVKNVNGAVSLADERTIFEHILRAEKYNFNNIIWRSFVKSTKGGIKEQTMSFQVDRDSGLKYPQNDSNDTINDLHDLEFFITKTRSYLQSWYIPFDLTVGTTDQTTENLNSKFAYDIMASAYHEIVLDRYKMETLTRTTNYRVYDQTTNTRTITRTCAEYKSSSTEECTKKGQIGCKDAQHTQIVQCDASRWALGYCSDLGAYYDTGEKCTDGTGGTANMYRYNTNGCSYGTKSNTTKKTYCIDDTKNTSEELKDVRESVSVSKDKDNRTYRWDYVISLAKLFDNVISNDYAFKAFKEYNTDNYYNFIEKKDAKNVNMTVEQFATSEQSESQADSYSHGSKEYKDKEKTTSSEWSWNITNVVSEIPIGWKKVKDVGSKVVYDETEIIKDGMEYTDKYVWNDKLEFEGTNSGIYNMDSVTDVTGDDLSYDDMSYYQGIYTEQQINLIDLMNSDKDIYDNYLSSFEMDQDTENIGIRKSALDMSYSVLKKDLKETMENFQSNGIRYGSSLGLDTNSFAILGGLDFTNVSNILAGNMDGYNVAYPIANEDLAYSYLDVLYFDGYSYGYSGHGGIDISYAYAKADVSYCTDYANKKMCPYSKGPGIYTIMDGTIEQIGYSAYNTWHNVGEYLGNSYDGKMRISDTSGWGSYVKVKNADGSAVIYAHLFPDREFLKQLSEHVGENISAGTLIGYMGNTGHSSGIHLHIECAPSVSALGGGKSSNSRLTYAYLQKIIDVMGIRGQVKLS